MNLTKSSLPALDSVQIQDTVQLHQIHSGLDAYHIILRAEDRAIQLYQKDNIMLARVVGHFLLDFCKKSYLFGLQSCSEIVLWVTSPPRAHIIESTGGIDDTSQVVYDVGRILRDKLIRTFRTCNTNYPKSTRHPSCESFDQMVKSTREKVVPSSSNNLRTKVMKRDGYCCLVTGRVDEAILHDLEHEQLREAVAQGHLEYSSVEVAHIFNASTMDIDLLASEDSAEGKKAHFATSAIAILRAFGLSHITDIICSQSVHQFWNFLSLDHTLHRQLDTLNMWFEGTEQPNHYQICFLDNMFSRALRNKHSPRVSINEDASTYLVDLSSQTKDPSPSPFLLNLHAICARVFHMSGAAEYFDELEWDNAKGSVGVLAFDKIVASPPDGILYSLAAVEVPV